MAECPQCGESFQGLGAGQLCPDCNPHPQTTWEDVPTDSPPTPNSPRPKIPVTTFLVLANIIVFSVSSGLGKYWPGLAWSGTSTWGSNWGPLTLHGEWWRLLSSNFVHFSFQHLLGNMVALWILGRRAEPIFGRWVFLGLYLSCGLAGSVASLAVRPEDQMCGASGAIFGLAGGLIGAYCLVKVRRLKTPWWGVALLITYVAYSVYEGGKTPGIDNAAHVTGLATGLLLGAILVRFSAHQPPIQRFVFSSVADRKS